MKFTLKFASLFMAVLITASCGLLPKKEVIRTEVVRDSIVYRNIVHLDTLLIKRDTFTNEFQIEALKQLGQLTFRGDRTTTKLIYRDGIYRVSTQSDSILKLIENRFTSLEKYKSTQATKQPIIYRKISYSWVKYISILGIVITIYLIILKIKR